MQGYCRALVVRVKPPALPKPPLDPVIVTTDCPRNVDALYAEVSVRVPAPDVLSVEVESCAVTPAGKLPTESVTGPVKP
jgi:hypothetical protein